MAAAGQRARYRKLKDNKMPSKARTKQYPSCQELGTFPSRTLRPSLCSELLLLFAVFAFPAACTAAPALAQTSIEQLDPTEILIEHLAEITAAPVESAIDVKDSSVQPDITPDAPTVSDAPAIKGEPNGQTHKQPTQKTSDDEQISYIESQYKLWQAAIAVPKEQPENAARKKLLQMAKKIRSLKFVPARTPEPFIVIKTPARPEPNETVPDQQQTLARRAEQGPLTRKTLQIIEEQSRHPQTQKCPFELAELLFRTGHLKLASVFYREALGRINPDDASLANKCAWILFKTANCLREHDRLNAKKFFARLITEYPTCPWFDIARISEQLIDWSEKEKPQTLIQQVALQ